MERYATLVRDGSVYVETDGDPIEIGPIDVIHELVGGESYEIVYEEDYARTVDWLDLDEDGSMSIDVLDTIEGMDFPGTFVQKLEERPYTASDDEAERTTYFVDVMTTIWDNKGNLSHLDENPFE